MSIWQTQSWGNMLQSSGQVEKMIELDGIFVEKRRVAFGQFGLFVQGLEKRVEDDFYEKLCAVCIEEKALFVQVETLDYTSKFGMFEEGLFAKGAYKKFMPPFTAFIDLTAGSEKILEAMKPKGRYNIKLAQKKGIVVKVLEKTDENIDAFYKVMCETTKRDGFAGNNKAYYQNFLQSLPESALLGAFYGEVLVAGGIFVFHEGVGIYYYGASINDEAYRNMMAPYLLQWEAISLAIAKGCHIFDFLGIATPGEKKSSLAGVTDFKLKLTPTFGKVSEGYIWIARKFLYNVIVFLKGVKK